MGAALVAVILAFSGPVASEAAAPFEVKVIGEGPPIVFLPGLSSSSEVWRETAAALCGDHECHLVTLAGFGGVKRSDGPMLRQSRDALWKYVKAKKLKRPILIGHSLGGMLALWMAATAPDQVGGVVSVDGVPFLPALMDPSATEQTSRAQAEAMKARYAQMTAEQFAQANAMAMGSMVTRQEALPGLLAMANASDPRAVGDAVFELMTTDLRGQMAKVTAPVLLVASAPWAATLELQERALSAYRAQVAKAPRHRVVLIPGARHFVMVDAQDALLGHVKAFLGSGE